MSAILPADMVRKLLSGNEPLTAEERDALMVRARIGKRIKLSPEARLDWRRKMNARAARMCRARRINKGLTSSGRPRKRLWRETVKIVDFGFVENGQQWVRITAPKTQLTLNAKVQLKWKPNPRGK